jgi:hypothetical protein
MKVRIILLLLVLFPVFQRVDAGKKEADEREKVYNLLKLGDLGLSYEAFKLALQGLDKLNGRREADQFFDPDDHRFLQSSKNKRMYVIDLYKKMLLFNTY